MERPRVANGTLALAWGGRSSGRSSRYIKKEKTIVLAVRQHEWDMEFRHAVWPKVRRTTYFDIFCSTPNILIYICFRSYSFNIRSYVFRLFSWVCLVRRARATNCKCFRLCDFWLQRFGAKATVETSQYHALSIIGGLFN